MYIIDLKFISHRNVDSLFIDFLINFRQLNWIDCDKNKGLFTPKDDDDKVIKHVLKVGKYNNTEKQKSFFHLINDET